MRLIEKVEVKKLIGCALAAAVVFGSACSSPRSDAAAIAPAPADDDVDPSREQEAPDVSSSPAAGNAPAFDTGEAVAAPAPAPVTAPGPKAQAGKAPVTRRPVAPDFPYETTVDVTARVKKACTPRGEVIRLTVLAPEGAAVAYQAVYSDSQGGAESPFGAGYGGNDKGMVGPTGTFTSSWVVSPSAPFGPGRVDVIVGFEGEWGYADPHFAVMDNDGGCPDRWLKA